MNHKKVFILGFSITGCAILKHVLCYFCDVTRIFCVDDLISEEEFVARTSLDCDDERIIFTNSIQASRVIENMKQHETKDVIVFCSPGIPMDNTLVVTCKACNIALSCDFDLLYTALLRHGISFHDGNDIAIFITGTVGKSTTSFGLASELRKMENENLAVILSGNIGIPVLSVYENIIAAKRERKRVVCIFELSSAQLELLNEFSPTISICLTVCVDHLDRYNSIEEYLYYKSKIFCHRKHEPIYNVLCIDSEYSQHILDNVRKFHNLESTAVSYVDRANEWYALGAVCEKREFIPFSTRDIANGVSFSEGVLSMRYKEKNRCAFQIESTAAIPKENIGVIALLTFLITNTPPTAQIDLQTLPHCLEQCYPKSKKYEVVKFINNSKATKQAAVEYSLSLYKNVLLIVGGKSKGEKLIEILTKFHNIKAIFLIGETTDRFAYEIEISNASLQYYRCYTLDIAMRSIKNVLDEGIAQPYTVLLSPMCSSLDQWKNFQERGTFFKNFIIDHY
ncbi:UDP-N-acetylmuramoylalanine--D-glutamate ligase [Candidatus Fokinia solitaria]|uniref:UDP-N-acetylmuramoylalanine--D-glutamate ligase n=1 Tax=Candidatus Fokinia solitaria TaxID=1802984 RepID=A0A2U8BRB9_9RICK|nr:Mur ligase family protein [Candidatus Fokinia solitaria]AWD32885.1 UDP-N-acetylmuramoylalanine--D-glutamate ligase [Candidatus Fokinia solitaria]